MGYKINKLDVNSFTKTLDSLGTNYTLGTITLSVNDTSGLTTTRTLTGQSYAITVQSTNTRERITYNPLKLAITDGRVSDSTYGYTMRGIDLDISVASKASTIVGLDLDILLNGTTDNAVSSLVGADIQISAQALTSGKAIASLFGLYLGQYYNGGTVSDGAGIDVRTVLNNDGESTSGTVSVLHGIRISAPEVYGSAVVDTAYAFLIGDWSAVGTNKYSLYVSGATAVSVFEGILYASTKLCASTDLWIGGNCANPNNANLYADYYHVYTNGSMARFNLVSTPGEDGTGAYKTGFDIGCYHAENYAVDGFTGTVIATDNSGGGTIGALTGLSVSWNSSGGGTVTTGYGLSIAVANGGSASITDLYGLYISGVADVTVTGNKYGLYVVGDVPSFFGGDLTVSGDLGVSGAITMDSKQVACGGGSTGSTTAADGTVTLEINGTTYYLLKAAEA